MTEIDTKKPSQLSEREFVDTFGSVYEHSPWIAEDAFRMGLSSDHDDAAGLSDYMASIVAASSQIKKLELLRLHPDLAGKLAQQGALTAASVEEQSGAGLDQCTPEEFAHFQDLNTRYTTKFGFPFIIAVREHKRPEILRIFEDRTDNNTEDEFAEALRQVNRIAAFRIAFILAK